MKNLTLLVAVTLGLAAVVVVGLWTSNGASAGDFDDGLKCYRVKDFQSKRPNNQLVYISDQFEEKNLIIKEPIAFCALAAKGGASPGATAGGEILDLVCYAIKDARGQNRFKPVEIETVDQFDQHNLIVNKPFALCEQALKYRFGTQGVTGGSILNDFSFKCYKVRRIENAGNRWEKFELDIFDQFYLDAKEVRLGRPSVFCTQVVEKKPKAKNDHLETARTLEGPEDEHHASTISAGRDRNDPPTDCADFYSHSVWYRYYASTNGEKIALNTEGSTYDTVVAVYKDVSGNATQLEEVACNDDKNFPSSGHSHVEVKLDGDYDYYIVVGAYGNDKAGKLKLSLLSLGACSSCFGGGGAVAGKDAPVEVAGETPLNLDCYSISQRAPEDAFILTQDQFNAHFIEIGRGIMYCTPVGEKCIVREEPRTGSKAGGPQIYFCDN